jgi:hypothetical protein
VLTNGGKLIFSLITKFVMSLNSADAELTLPLSPVSSLPGGRPDLDPRILTSAQSRIEYKLRLNSHLVVMPHG